MGFPIEMYVIQATHGLVFGMLIFLVASGLTIVFGMMGVLNFAHAAFYMLGAYVAYSVTAYSVVVYSGNFWLSLVISSLIVGTLGILIERFLLRKTYKIGQSAQLLLTFGFLFILNELVRIIRGSAVLPATAFELLTGNISFLRTEYPVYRLFIIGVSFLVLIAMAVLLLRTRIGVIIRVAVTDAKMVEALGTNVPRVFMAVFGPGGAIAALAGVIAAPFLALHSNSINPGLLKGSTVVSHNLRRGIIRNEGTYQAENSRC